MAHPAYHGAGARLGGFLVAACVAAWGAPPSAAALGAARVVSLSPVGTEIVLALGQGERLVAVDAASATLPGVRNRPLAKSATAGTFSPDLVLVPEAEAEAARRSAPSALLIEVAPHNFDDAWALCTSVGAALGREQEARRFVREASRPLAEIGSESFGQRRPRVAAVLTLVPLEVAGGHSFVTDLIETAGGESVSHGTEEPRLFWTTLDFARAEPELVVVVTPHAPSPEQRERAGRLFGPGLRVEFLVLDAERHWLSEALPAARQLRKWIEGLATAPRRAR